MSFRAVVLFLVELTVAALIIQHLGIGRLGIRPRKTDVSFILPFWIPPVGITQTRLPPKSITGGVVIVQRSGEGDLPFSRKGIGEGIRRIFPLITPAGLQMAE